MKKYRVFSLSWIDVYASDASYARHVAGDIYYGLDSEDRESLPSVVVARRFDDNDGGSTIVDDVMAWHEWSPSNDPF